MTTFTAYPVADGQMLSDATAANYGSIDNMSLGLATGKTFSAKRALMEFDLSLLFGRYTIDSATLYMNVDAVSGTLTENFYWLTSNETEPLVEDEFSFSQYSAGNAWASAGGDLLFAAPFVGPQQLPGGTGPVNYDFTTLAQDADNRDGILRFAGRRFNESSTTGFVVFSTKETADPASDAPRLVIEASRIDPTTATTKKQLRATYNKRVRGRA